ncbi:hypothetical protein C2845_PM07G38430 [Panicum miliaceum]|uniref:Uncharacterized protein n=1 Tax=Panicum miliaceum TaxID=4540 RepID=A0A3L6SQE5_PANMI|nr:hypothetical protein C2845_PM07G38430 [Panicum miliaceum]
MAPPTDSIATVLAKLEELGRKIDDTNLKADETNRNIEEMQLSIQQNTDEQSLLSAWKPGMEDKVTDLQNSVFDLKQKNLEEAHSRPIRVKKPNIRFAGSEWAKQ